MSKELKTIALVILSIILAVSIAALVISII